ncbi:MAG: FAD-binding protein, partial [Clostridia bacterium]|nr:FAD-binding protein [Clostridia bacterium]
MMISENRKMDFDAVVIGSGAAAYNAASRIAQGGKKSVCIVTEGVRMGTSRNTGSDKQTYYKLNLGASPEDSVRKMAEDLFACGCVDGDTAFCEAALSARCFFYLTELGVPFPCGPYGEYVGYKTDHDPCARASSAGPLTSRFMTEALEREAARLGVPVYGRLYVTEILTDENGVCGIAAVRTDTGAFRAIRCRYAVLATGGPAGIYADSVYPACHTGSTSLALKAGASLQNMTEW